MQHIQYTAEMYSMLGIPWKKGEKTHYPTLNFDFGV